MWGLVVVGIAEFVAIAVGIVTEDALTETVAVEVIAVADVETAVAAVVKAAADLPGVLETFLCCPACFFKHKTNKQAFKKIK